MDSFSSDLAELLAGAGPAGLAADELARRSPQVSRSTLNRRLAGLVRSGVVRVTGAGRSTRYVSASPLTRADIDAWFATPPHLRPLAVFKEELLQPEPNIAPDKAQRCEAIQAIANKVDKRFLTNFLVDFSWGSSLLEGSSYSALDTQALIEYGQKNNEKPTADAVLVLDHKTAVEYLWKHRELSAQNVCAMHALLTHDHGLPDVADSDHFLPEHQRGKPREYEEVNLGSSAYLPPFRPGTGFARQALDRIIEQARALHPVEAALYLMTRIPYVQVFANGNKRASRLAANAALMSGGLLPFSFADVDKAEYIRGMAAFYELGSTLVIEQTFIHGYVRSVIRGSDIPVRMRTRGFDVEGVATELVDFINTGRKPQGERARIFLRV
ncbi:Fic family protein [Ramlibacter albus]|uniref:Fic family protein n=1 Tax=Ramlibacter albus TaxID=2079448 RepID=A0A923S7R4_9BURK|nr:Fic family protein [Ramlibacter albus]MBC5767362.1 Fic family protein [Ramlibacter albus]